LQRDLFGAIRDALAPGGAVIYETFTTVQRALGRGPTSPEHLLEPGELARHFEGFERLFYEETGEPEAVARLVARRPSRPQLDLFFCNATNRSKCSGGNATAPGAPGPCASSPWQSDPPETPSPSRSAIDR